MSRASLSQERLRERLREQLKSLLIILIKADDDMMHESCGTHGYFLFSIQALFFCGRKLNQKTYHSKVTNGSKVVSLHLQPVDLRLGLIITILCGGPEQCLTWARSAVSVSASHCLRSTGSGQIATFLTILQ